MKLGRELSIKNENHLNIKSGYVDKFNYPNSQYIKINGWVQLNNNAVYNRKSNRDLKDRIKNIILTIEKTHNIIVDIDCSEQRLNSNSVTYLNILINYINPKILVKSKEFKNYNVVVIDRLIQELNNYFQVINKKGLVLN